MFIPFRRKKLDLIRIPILKSLGSSHLFSVIKVCFLQTLGTETPPNVNVGLTKPLAENQRKNYTQPLGSCDLFILLLDK